LKRSRASKIRPLRSNFTYSAHVTNVLNHKRLLLISSQLRFVKKKLYRRAYGIVIYIDRENILYFWK